MSQPPDDIEIRELSSPDELEELVRVFDDVWRPDPTRRPVTTDMLRALAHSGNYVVGAFIGDHLAGGSVAFFAAPAGRALHSHMTGVSRRGRGHHVGHALKSHQRTWALDRGLREITWTFDPLVARNAYFNITKLGAVPRHYYEDFYGEIGDELGGGDDSDRVLTSWDIDTATPDECAGLEAAALVAGGAVPGIDSTDPTRPRSRVADITPESTVVIPVPRDIEAMRQAQPLVAARWRIALREALGPLLGDGAAARSVRFLRSGHYLLGPRGSGR